MPSHITVQHLSKRFRRYHAERPTTLKEALLHGFRRIKPAEYFWALRDVSLHIAPGRMVGVIGPNGAGKSTLLRLIGGVGRPDEGHVTAHGRIGALLDLGAGFHPDLTGRENVFINGVIAGLTRHEVARRFDAIVAFAELEASIDSPLHTYSTGMQMRLGFAVVAHTDPEILLIDEILAVGDLAFQRKCLDRIAQFKAQGCTIVLVSHDTHSIQKLCDEALWLRQGELVAYGPADVITGQYVAEMSVQTRQRTPATHPAVRTALGTELQVNENRFGSMEIEIVAVRLLDAAGQPITELDSGAPLCVEIEYLAPNPVPEPIFGITISREDGLVCYDTHTSAAGHRFPTVHGPGRLAFQIERLELVGGQYYVDVGVYESAWSYAYDYHWHVYPLCIHPTGDKKGVLCPPSHWDVGHVTVFQTDPLLRARYHDHVGSTATGAEPRRLRTARS